MTKDDLEVIAEAMAEPWGDPDMIDEIFAWQWGLLPPRIAPRMPLSRAKAVANHS